MKPERTFHLNRRTALKVLLLTPTSAFLVACGRALGFGNPTPTATISTVPIEAIPTIPTATPLEPTPACDDGDDDLTLSQTEGPFYTPETPERTSLLEEGITGTLLSLTGLALGTDCQPLSQVLIDFWHCDANGVYDNQGYTLRGHQFTDADGRYTLETILPGLYPGRTRHIHVKVQAANQPVLTTQLYFPNEPDNTRDRIFDSRLLVNLQSQSEGMMASFDFVLPVG